MNKADFLEWANGWVSAEYTYDMRKAGEIEKFDPKAALMLRNVGNAVRDLEHYLKTKLADRH